MTRIQLVMAWGTGKTLVGRWHTQASSARRIVVFVPSLALVAQTLAEWRRPGRAWPFRALVVCSDLSTTAGQAERGIGDNDQEDADGDVDSATWEGLRTASRRTPDTVTRFVAEQTTVSYHHVGSDVEIHQLSSITITR